MCVCVNIYVYLLHIQLRTNVYIPFSESANVIILQKKEGHTICMYCLFSTDLNKIFHIKDVYI